VARARVQQVSARQAEKNLIASSASYARARARAVAPPNDDASLIRTTVQGLHWWVPVLRPGDAEPDSPWLRKQKFPYRAIAQTREVAMGGIMLDIGANLGRMSLPRVILGDATAAYCAEPDPLNYECLVRTITDNGLGGLMLPDNVAIGDREGPAVLSRQRYSGGHTLGSAPSKSGTVEVTMTTLDLWVSRLGIDLDLATFVKVDVQGWEGHVFAGAAGVLQQRHLAWQVEFDPTLLHAAGTAPEELCRLFGEVFTHFTDLKKSATGGHGRPTAELVSAVAVYMDGGESGSTDLLLFNQRDTVA
jgi:FkbM family methyltransferase